MVAVLMLAWLLRRQENRITRAWLRETARDQELLKEHPDYATDENGTTIMTPKRSADEKEGRDG
jgi:hypothetical protein